MKHTNHSKTKAPPRTSNSKGVDALYLRKAKADVVNLCGAAPETANKPKKGQKRFKPTTRKQARKQQRQLKKLNRQEQHAKKYGKHVALQDADDIQGSSDPDDEHFPEDKVKEPTPKKALQVAKKQEDEEAKLRKKKREEKEAKRQRVRLLRTANKDEDKIIKQMEKHLKLNKRKSKTLPKSFVEDGLDYLLDLCDEETRGKIAKEEMDFGNVEVDFEDDLAAVVGKPAKKETKLVARKAKTSKTDPINSQSSDDEFDGDMNENEEEENDEENDVEEELSEEMDSFDEEGLGADSNEDSDEDNDVMDTNDKYSSTSKEKGTKLPAHLREKSEKKVTFEMEEEEGEFLGGSEESEEDIEETEKPESKLWEDIYGRLRDKAGNVIKADQPVDTVTGRYVPPFRRQAEDTDDTLLRRTLKGLLNRLAENNMASIANQIEELYLKHSRQTMHKVLSGLFLDSLITPILTPERLTQEHALLLSVLHANVGMEVGAMMLETIVKLFDELYKTQPTNVQSKEQDNLLLLLAHMYNFKVVGHTLMYDIMNHIVERFEEKDVELALLGFRTIGFGLRKDDPTSLKQLIVSVQTKASQMASTDQSRLKFMLEVIMAIRNNHMAKIPGYDYTHVEHLKKLNRGLIRKGVSSTPLQVHYHELLSANSRGRWWVVGSAWEGHGPESKTASNQASAASGTPKFSAELLVLARKQRMNTEARRGIFCILMTAEDFLEAFQRLMRLDLKGNQEREILHVILHCSLQEKQFNPYYAHLASKFCLTDRKYQLNLQFALWDKFREIVELKAFQMSNLAKFTAFLLSAQALQLSVLKAIEFSAMDRTLLRFTRQLLLSYLLQATEDSLQTSFTKLRTDKLRVLREGLRLFLHHFLLKNIDKMPAEESAKLQQRVHLVDRVLSAERL